MNRVADVTANGTQQRGGNDQRATPNDVVPQVVAVDTPQPVQQQQQQPNNQFGAVRDRLFHAMLVRVALSYTRHVPRTARRFVEFSTLLTAISLLGLMMYVHVMFGKADSTCLTHLVDTWPRDGVLRVEVINNLDKFNAYQEKLAEEWQHRHAESNNSTPFDLKRILIEGPLALPKELRSKPKHPGRRKSDHWSSFLSPDETLFNLFLKPDWNAKKRLSLEEYRAEDGETFDYDDEALFDDAESEATFEYVVEYSLHYGLLRLPHAYRLEHNIPFHLVRLDPEKDECFGDWLSRGMMKYLIGYEDVLMASVKALAENETDKGYLRDMITGEHYRFVTMGSAKTSYLTALFVMLIFTFAISMLLRFSHHQIFLFIVDLLQMFELNQALVFPAAPLLTVILALVGMEAIMSEVFNDTSTAFYVILLVWVADQYDAICCHSPISKRHWLRFFYLYHYAFYAYQYRYNGQYGGLALLASTFFILHSMIFFFHHYELPLILYHERLQRIISDLQHNPGPQQGAATDMAEIVPRTGDVNTQLAAGDEPQSNTTDVELNLMADGNATNTSTVTDISTNAPSSSSADNEQLSTSGEQRLTTDDNGNSEQWTSGPSELDTAIDDPLLIAGERTARQIVENAMNSLFES